MIECPICQFEYQGDLPDICDQCGNKTKPAIEG